MSASINYWRETLICSLDGMDAANALTDEQLLKVAKDIETAAENYGQFSGRDCVPDPREAEFSRERKSFQRQLKEAEANTVIMRDAFAAMEGIEPRRLGIHNGRVEVSRT